MRELRAPLPSSLVLPGSHHHLIPGSQEQVHRADIWICGILFPQHLLLELYFSFGRGWVDANVRLWAMVSVCVCQGHQEVQMRLVTLAMRSTAGCMDGEGRESISAASWQRASSVKQRWYQALPRLWGASISYCLGRVMWLWRWRLLLSSCTEYNVLSHQNLLLVWYRQGMSAAGRIF